MTAGGERYPDPSEVSLTPAGRAAGRPQPGSVSLDLSGDQVDQVMREAFDTAALSFMLVGRAGARAARQAAQQDLDDKRLSRSLVCGLLMLSAFPADRSSVRLVDIARDLDLRKSTAHRYLSTLVAVGLVERDEETRGYRVAP
jgi:hypothetical protein